MTTLPVADGARLLGIHPKTLQHWLKQAQVPLVAHPTDARITCVEWERIQQVASLHGRPVASAGQAPGVVQFRLPGRADTAFLVRQSWQAGSFPTSPF